eukprot:Hpha_TRINITY_DN15504_c0_g8::TRINITY_DN15504_c0_g8_i1::g.107061::m.107061
MVQRPPRVAFGGIVHETNTFATRSLGLTDRNSFRPIVGDEILQRKTGALGGMLDAARELGCETVGLLFGMAMPSGTISDLAYKSMRGELLQRLDVVMADGPLDAVALELHGAGVAESCPDIEADLVLTIRARVGPDVAIVGAFDLHGNISAECARAFDFMVPCRYYPHTDTFETGQQVVRMLPRLLGEGGDRLRTEVHVERVPTLLPVSMMCTQPGFPAAEMNELCCALEARHQRVLNCSVFHGFPFADIDICGTTVIVTTDGDAALARRVGREVGRWIWANRQRFVSTASGAVSAVAAARRATRGPVVINETADNVGAGAPGDATHLLRALLASDAAVPFKPGEAAFGWIYDSAALRSIIAAGVGNTVHLSLGGKLDSIAGEPVVATAEVVALTDGRFEAKPGAAFSGGMRDLGPMARVRIGNVDVLVNAYREQCYEEHAFTLAGIDVRACQVIGLKSSTHFRGGWQDIAAQVITADEPGVSTNRLDALEALRRNKLAHWPTTPGAVYEHTSKARL